MIVCRDSFGMNILVSTIHMTGILQLLLQHLSKCQKIWSEQSVCTAHAVQTFHSSKDVVNLQRLLIDKDGLATQTYLKRVKDELNNLWKH